MMPQRGMPPAASAETPVAALGPIEVARANAPPSLTMTPLLRWICRAPRRRPDAGPRQDRERHRHFADGAGCPEKTEIRNCVTWVTIELFLHTQVWWWHEAKFPDPPLDPS